MIAIGFEFKAKADSEDLDGQWDQNFCVDFSSESLVTHRCIPYT